MTSNEGELWYSESITMKTDPITTLLTRGVDTIYPTREALEAVLRSGKKLRLYQGFDPTGTQLHIGHAVGFRKLRQWQDLGHEVIFLIGDGTGQAGDPTGKKKTREKFFTRDELRQNGRDYVMQASKIVRFDGPNPVRILYNGDWLNELKLVDILGIAQHFSVQQLIERDMFQERMKKYESINLREFLYPLLQGYDSVAMEVDLELGGTDQTFNMLAGRTLVGAILNKEKFVMTTPLLTDSKGTKIGKTEGNVIALTDTPADFYSNIMALGDDAIIPCFRLLTDMPEDRIRQMQQSIESGSNPMTYKKQLAHTLTAWLNDEPSADAAQMAFESRVQNKNFEAVQLPEIPFSTIQKNPTLSEVIIGIGFSHSRSEIKRLIKQGAIDINNNPLMKDSTENIKQGDIITVGKKKAFKVTD